MSSQPSPIMNFLPFILMFAVFYFLLIRPQQKKQKDHQKFIGSLSKNQAVVTMGGVHGTIALVKENTAILRVAENVKIEVDKSSISHSKNSEEKK